MRGEWTKELVIGGQGHVWSERVGQNPVERRYPHVYALCKHLAGVVRRGSERARVILGRYAGRTMAH